MLKHMMLAIIFQMLQTRQMQQRKHRQLQGFQLLQLHRLRMPVLDLVPLLEPRRCTGPKGTGCATATKVERSI